jgi:hypothetical protein
LASAALNRFSAALAIKLQAASRIPNSHLAC